MASAPTQTPTGGPAERYLKSSSMVTLQKSMTIAANVLGFDILELWSMQGSDVNKDDCFHCTYVHAGTDILHHYPDIIAGYYPEHKRKHTISPQLCRIALESKNGYYWHTLIEGDDEILCLKSSAQTEVAYLLQGQELPFPVFVVGFSVKPVEFLHSKIKFLSGIGYAIYVTAFVEDGRDSTSADFTAGELDVAVKGLPRRPSRQLIHIDDAAQIARVDSNVSMEIVETYNQMNKNDFVAIGSVDEFEYPLLHLPLSTDLVVPMHLDQLKEVTHFADGSNSNVYSALYNGDPVVVKMVKKTACEEYMALHEFDVEFGVLSRIAHPNIVKLIGAGHVPRRFLVLEWLGGGTLQSLLAKNQSRSGITQGLFRQPTFTYSQILSRARDLAEAFDYLHTRVSPDMTVIHRDLKPDNVGFTVDGSIKLLDLGLSTCVKRRTDAHIAYEMTGNTGSLRYMAPEVALRKAYTEKVDVYSFGILLWQMASDTTPFKGMSRDVFMKEVVLGKLRPKLDSSWPVGFCNLLTTCWHNDAVARPSFSTAIIDINSLIDELDGRSWPKRGKTIRILGSAPPQSSEDGAQSSWF